MSRSELALHSIRASLTVICMITAFATAPSAQAQVLVFEEQHHSDFAVRNVKRGSVPFSVRFENEAALEKAGFGEVLKHLPRSESKTQLLVMKSAVIVSRPISDFRSSSIISNRVIKSLFRLFRPSPTSLTNQYHFSRDLTDMAPGFVLKMMGFPLALKTTCDFDHTFNGPEILGVSGKLDHALGVPSAAILQTCGAFNLMFTSSVTLSRYYPIEGKRTLAVTLQVARVRQSTIEKADPIPFFNLERTLKDQFRKEVQSFWEALHRVTL